MPFYEHGAGYYPVQSASPGRASHEKICLLAEVVQHGYSPYYFCFGRHHVFSVVTNRGVPRTSNCCAQPESNQESLLYKETPSDSDDIRKLKSRIEWTQQAGTTDNSQQRILHHLLLAIYMQLPASPSTLNNWTRTSQLRGLREGGSNEQHHRTPNPP